MDPIVKKILEAVDEYRKEEKRASEELDMGLYCDAPNADWWGQLYEREIKEAEKILLTGIRQVLGAKNSD